MVVLALVLVGCMFQKINEQDLYGSYRADLPGGGTESLELLPEGNCKQEIRLPDGETYNSQGTWKFFPDTKYLQVRGIRQSLTPEGQINPDIAAAPGKEVFATPVYRSLSGAMEIMLHEDINYRKQKK